LVASLVNATPVLVTDLSRENLEALVKVALAANKKGCINPSLIQGAKESASVGVLLRQRLPAVFEGLHWWADQG
jgi:hypothetical protein